MNKDKQLRLYTQERKDKNTIKSTRYNLVRPKGSHTALND